MRNVRSRVFQTLIRTAYRKKLKITHREFFKTVKMEYFAMFF